MFLKDGSYIVRYSDNTLSLKTLEDFLMFLNNSSFSYKRVCKSILVDLVRTCSFSGVGFISKIRAKMKLLGVSDEDKDFILSQLLKEINVDDSEIDLFTWDTLMDIREYVLSCNNTSSDKFYSDRVYL